MGATSLPLDCSCSVKRNETIEDRFVPRDDACLKAQGQPEGRHHKLTVIASAAWQSSLFLIRDRLVAPKISPAMLV